MKSTPKDIMFDRTIGQYYFEEDGVFKRVRESQYANGTEYHLTIKTPREEGKIGYNEFEESITKTKFLEKVSIAYSYITKDRFIRKCNVNEGLTWEIDNFISIPMVKMEMELPSDDYDLIIPNDMKEFIILETTDFKEFSNRSLSKKIEF